MIDNARTMEWIDCDANLPQEDVSVLVTDGKDVWTDWIKYYKFGKPVWIREKSQAKWWMPYPLPPAQK